MNSEHVVKADAGIMTPDQVGVKHWVLALKSCSEVESEVMLRQWMTVFRSAFIDLLALRTQSMKMTVQPSNLYLLNVF